MFKRLLWYWKADRLGPDMLSTHPLLFFSDTNRWLCKRKFKEFGEGSEFRPYAYAISTANISIGNGVIIRPGTVMVADDTGSGHITIEDDVAIGMGVHLYANSHVYDRADIPIRNQGFCPSKPIRICKGAWIGACSIILIGVTIGRNAVVGAGSIVTKDVEPYTVVAGNPARKIKTIM